MLNALERGDELFLLHFAQGPQPGFLVLMHDRPERLGDLPACLR